jgi:CMP-N,N'-diacetyllegionaminic acid synthase
MTLLIVVPARGGSKRLPRKNIATLCGMPLLLHTIDCIRRAGLLDRAVVSTEDTAIAEVAQQAAARVVMRPDEFATDTASTESVLLDALAQDQTAGNPRSEWIMTLPPTSPLREPETLTRFVAEIDRAAPDVDCIMSVTENRGDFWRWYDGGEFRRLFPDAPRRQQDRAPLFEENSAIYLTRVTSLQETGFILGRKVLPIAIGTAEALDINTADDLELAEALLARRQTRQH